MERFRAFVWSCIETVFSIVMFALVVMLTIAIGAGIYEVVILLSKLH